MTRDQEDPRWFHGAELALGLGSDLERRVGRAVQTKVEQRGQSGKARGTSGTEEKWVDLECGL